MRTIMGKEFARNTRDDAFNPLWNHYRCADGKWIALAMLQPDRYWKDFCAVIGKAELIEDPRFADVKSRGKNAARLVAIFDEVFADTPARRVDANPQGAAATSSMRSSIRCPTCPTIRR